MREPTATTLEGHGVRLEPLRREHVDDLFAAGAYDAVWTWLASPRPRLREDMEEQVEAALADPDRVPFAVVVGGRAVGSSSYFDVDLEVNGLEIGGTWYTPELWGGPVNPACKLLLLGHAFDALGAERVTLKTDGLNARSQAAIRKLGASYDGTLRHHRRRGDGTVRDSAYFSILAAEWLVVREQLGARLSGLRAP